MAKRYVVIYRTGGTENFQWHTSCVFTARDEARAAESDLERMGYAAHVADAALVASIGLPDTYCAGCRAEIVAA